MAPATRPKTVVLTPELHAYLLDQSPPADPLLDELAARTRALVPDQAHMLIAPEEGVLLTFLARLVGTHTALEVGTFTGYSSVCLARGLVEGGRLITCDVSPEWTGIAREFWERAGVSDKVTLRLGPAVRTLRSLPSEPFLDLVFIDADKPGYIDYWEELVPRVRPGGLLIIDNTLFNGEVIDPNPGPKPAAIRAFNSHAAADRRVELVMLAVADGLTLARKLS
jgi:caffeoyl-CoA O-methyltransferase